MRSIILGLSLVSLFACGEEQNPVTQQPSQSVEIPTADSVTPSEESENDNKDWQDAKRSTQQALQDIWDASKETTQELVEEGSTSSKQLWQSGKQKSSELWEQGKENSIDIWNDIESGSKATWSEGQEKIQQLLPEQSEPNNSISVDEI